MQIRPGLYKLTGVRQGANAYLWNPKDQGEDAGPLLFDCGWPWSGPGIIASLETLGCRPTDIHSIVITHDDFDHAGQLASLSAASGAEVIAHQLEVPRLAAEKWRKLPGIGGPIDLFGLAANKFSTSWPHPPVRVQRPVVDGEQLPGGWVVVHTPGHTPGHASYFHPALRVLIGGDALGQGLTGGLIAPKRVYTEDAIAAARSIRKLAQLEPNVLCLGHGPMVYGAAGKLSKLADSVLASTGRGVI